MTTKKATTSTVGTGPAVPDAAATGDPEAIRADIAQTRAELGDSVEALAAKADVKARAKRGLTQVKARAKDTAEAAKHRVRQTAEAAKDGAKETAEQVSERAKESAGQVGETVRRRPAPVAAALAGVAAVVIGSVVFIRWRRARAGAGIRRWRKR
jgi:hypothetical protein